MSSLTAESNSWKSFPFCVKIIKKYVINSLLGIPFNDSEYIINIYRKHDTTGLFIVLHFTFLSEERGRLFCCFITDFSTFSFLHKLGTFINGYLQNDSFLYFSNIDVSTSHKLNRPQDCRCSLIYLLWLFCLLRLVRINTLKD